MIIAHHLIFTSYGYWLPNDPRSSLSKEVVIEKIADLGPLHYGRKQNQPTSQELNDFRNRAKEVLKFPVFEFSDDDLQLIARGFAEEIEKSRYTCYACAIILDHVHLIIRKHRDSADMMIEKLQNTSREFLFKDSNSTFADSSTNKKD